MKTKQKTQRFAILTSQRSGSNYLEQTLDSNDNVRCYGEILLGFDGPDGRQNIPRILERRPRPAVAASAFLSGGLLFPTRKIEQAYANTTAPAVGFRVMYNHASSGVLRMLEEDEISVVHLTRRNVLRQVVSRLQMHNAHILAGTYQAHREKGTRLALKGVTTVATANVEIAKRVDELIARRTKTSRWLDGRVPSLEIAYEDLLPGGELDQQVLDEVAGFLNIEGDFAPSRLGRTGSAGLSEIVQDTADLRRLLEAKGRGWMVDDW